MGQRYVGEGDSGAINFAGYGFGQRLAMAWSLLFNCRVLLPYRFEVTTSLPEPEPPPTKEPPTPGDGSAET